MYLQISEFISSIPALTQAENKTVLEGIVAQIIFNASRLFDSVTQAPENYYADNISEDYLERVYIPNGTNFVHTHHFEVLGDVLVRGSSVLPYTRQRDKQLLEIGRLNLHPDNVTVIAKWGFKRIPEDVKEAIRCMANLRLSQIPLGRIGINDGQGLTELGHNEARNTWNVIVEKYRHGNKFAYENTSFGEAYLVEDNQPMPIPDNSVVAFSYTQTTPSTEWIINHNLGYQPIVVVYDNNGFIVLADVVNTSDNQVRIFFALPSLGEVRCV